jgi:hypothetical protein
MSRDSVYPKELRNEIGKRGVKLVWHYGLMGFAIVSLVIIAIAMVVAVIANLSAVSMVLLPLGALISCGGLGALLWIEVPKKHVGIPLLFNSRIDGHLLAEGGHILLPSPLMGFEAVEVDKRNFKCTQEVMVPGAFEDLRMRVTAQMDWQIIDPLLSTNAEKFLENNLSNEAIGTIVQSAYRRAAINRNLSSRQLMFLPDGINDLVLEDLQRFSEEKELGVMFSKLHLAINEFNNLELERDFERLKRELAQRQIEVLDTETLVKRINLMIKNTGLSGQEAVDELRGLRGKLNRNRYEFDISGLDEAFRSVIDSLQRK